MSAQNWGLKEQIDFNSGISLAVGLQGFRGTILLCWPHGSGGVPIQMIGQDLRWEDSEGGELLFGFEQRAQLGDYPTRTVVGEIEVVRPLEWETYPGDALAGNIEEIVGRMGEKIARLWQELPGHIVMRQVDALANIANWAAFPKAGMESEAVVAWERVRLIANAEVRGRLLMEQDRKRRIQVIRALGKLGLEERGGNSQYNGEQVRPSWGIFG